MTPATSIASRFSNWVRRKEFSTYGNWLRRESPEPRKTMRWLCSRSCFTAGGSGRASTLPVPCLCMEKVIGHALLQLGPPPQYGGGVSFLADAGRLAASAFHRGWPWLSRRYWVYWLWRFHERTELSARLSASSAGALGNVADRLRCGIWLRRGSFLDFQLCQWHWPSFNLADVWIVSVLPSLSGPKYGQSSQAAVRAESARVFAVAPLDPIPRYT